MRPTEAEAAGWGMCAILCELLASVAPPPLSTSWIRKGREGLRGRKCEGEKSAELRYWRVRVAEVGT